MIGQKFSRLKVIKKSGKDKHKNKLYLCICDCGNTKIVRASHLRTGFVKSCGCLQSESRKKSYCKHGHCSRNKTKTYRSWRSMMARCYNTKHPHYKNYGGRGILVCIKWFRFEGFLDDMGERPNGMTLDRIEDAKIYCKSTCRWATYKQQGRNRRNNRMLKYGNQIHCLTEWAEITGIKKTTLRERLSRGWSVEKSLTLPVERSAV